MQVAVNMGASKILCEIIAKNPPSASYNLLIVELQSVCVNDLFRHILEGVRPTLERVVECIASYSFSIARCSHSSHLIYNGGRVSVASPEQSASSSAQGLPVLCALIHRSVHSMEQDVRPRSNRRSLSLEILQPSDPLTLNLRIILSPLLFLIYLVFGPSYFRT
jgi:hypothetical protein